MKKLKLLLAILALCALMACVVLFGSPYAPVVQPCRDVEELWAIEDERQESMEPLVTSLLNHGIPLAYDEEYNTFYCPLGLETGTDWPNIHLTAPGAKGVTICFADDYGYDWCDEAIREGYAYQLMAYTDEEYAYFDVVFTGLPVLTLNADKEFTADEDTQAELTFSGAAEVLKSHARVHKRGQTSLISGMKHGLKVEFTRNERGSKKVMQEMPGIGLTDEFILIPCAADPDMMRDRLSWALYSSIAFEDEPFGARTTAYTEVFINGEYQGVYVMMKPYDLADELAKSNADAPAVDMVYRSASRMPLENRPMIADENGIYYKLYYESESADSFAALKTFLALMAEEDDEAFCRMALDELDIDSVLRYGLFVQACGLTDNVNNNMYIWAHHLGGKTVYRLAAWDLDVSWGRDDEQNSEVWYPFDLFDRLIELDCGGAREKLKNIWAQMRASAFTGENVESLIAQYTHELGDSGAFARDAEYWGGALTYPDAYYISSYAGFRFEMMDRRIEEIVSEDLAGRKLRIEGYTTFDEGEL